MADDAIIAYNAAQPFPFARRLQNAMTRNQQVRFSKYASLATLDKSGGFPSCRTVRVREVYEDTAIVITTDSRTEKVRELSRNPIAELCWNFAVTREQFRIRSRVVVVDSACSDEKLQAYR